MCFMNEVTERECALKKYVREYKGQPLVVLGGGRNALGIVKYLKENNIYDFYVAVDRQFYKPNQYLEKYEIKLLDDVLIKMANKYC